MQLINIGYGNLVSGSRILAIVGVESAPIKRMIQEAKEQGRLIDATCGRKTSGVIVTDGDLLILSALDPKRIAARVKAEGEGEDSDE